MEREMSVYGNIFGNVNVYVNECLYVVVNIFEFKTFVISCKCKLEMNIQCILRKLWIMYGHYGATFIDTVYHDEDVYSPMCELTCSGYIVHNCAFEFDDHCILKANYHEECCVRREYYKTEKAIENHMYKEATDIYICSNMLKVVHGDMVINNISVPESYDMALVLNCIFNTLSCPSGFIIKTRINQVYTYNASNLEYLMSRNYKLPCFSPFKNEYTGCVVNNGKEYILETLPIR